MSTETRRRAAAALIRRGAAPIPVPAGEKNPARPGWESLRITEEEIPDYWTNGQNVGLLCGEPSGWRVDVDLDADEAVKVAFRFLPATLTGGRESRPHSHCWYVARGAESADWKDIDGKKLVELRSTGRQTLVAPSTHPGGDEYVWHSETGLRMAEVPAAELRERCRGLATAALIARHVPPEGSRHDYAMALAGFVLRDGRMKPDLALKILKAAWHAAGADSREALRDLEGIVSDTVENLAAGEPVVGGPTLEEHAPGIVRLLCKWWGWERKPQAEDKEEKEERRNQADRLIGYALEDVQELFVDQHGAPHALIASEPVPLTSRCYSWFRRLMWEEEGRSVSGEYLKMAAGTLSAHAEFSGEVRRLHTRSKGGTVLIVVGVLVLLAFLIFGLISTAGNVILTITGVGPVVEFLGTGRGVLAGFVVAVFIILLGVAFLTRATPHTQSVSVIQQTETAQAAGDREVERLRKQLRRADQELDRYRALLSDPTAQKQRDEKLARERCIEVGYELFTFINGRPFVDPAETVAAFKQRHQWKVDDVRVRMDEQGLLTPRERDVLTFHSGDQLDKIEAMVELFKRLGQGG